MQSPAEFQVLALNVAREHFPDHQFAAGADAYTIVMDDFTIGLTNIRARVEQEGASSADRHRVLTEFLAADMYVAYVVDLPTRMMYVSKKDVTVKA